MNLSNIAEIIIEGYFFCCFVRPFIRKRHVAEWTGITYFLMMLFLWLVPWEVRYSDLCGMAGAFVVMYLLERRNLEQINY